MSNKTQPTPEQLAKWREEFGNSYGISKEYIEAAILEGRNVSQRWQGYLRAKQENEQALKDARKQALEEVLAISNSAARNYCNHDYFELKQAIKELLK